MTSSNTNYLPKAPPPNTIILDLRAHSINFEETQTIQSKHLTSGIKAETRIKFSLADAGYLCVGNKQSKK